MKICKLLASAFVYGLFLIMASALWAGDKGLSWEGISSANLNKEGFVRIIIGVDVPNIAKLSAASSQHQVITPQEAKSGPRTGAINADRALEQAIGQAADLVLSNLAKSDAKINRRYSAFPFVALSVNKKAFEALKANPGVTSIEVDIPVGLPLPVRDNGPKGAGGPSSANANWGPPKIGADTAWASGYTGAGWYVAILDTGIRKTHEMFAGKTIVEACYALGEDGVGPAGDCPNGLTSQTGSGSAVHYEGSYEGYDHGTHVAGIAAGWKSDGSVAGVAKDANIIAVKIFSKFSADYCGDTACVLSWNSDQLAGLNYVYTLRNTYSIAAANMSLGGDSYSAACDGASQKAGVDALRSVGIATAIATGNNGWCGAISSPGCISSSIAVSSSTSGDTKSDFSNWHNTLTTLFAPGSEIYSSTGASNTSYGIWSGTSMATPHVTGAWAILRQNRPSESVTSILSAVLAGGVNISPCGDGS